MKMSMTSESAVKMSSVCGHSHTMGTSEKMLNVGRWNGTVKSTMPTIRFQEITLSAPAESIRCYKTITLWVVEITPFQSMLLQRSS